MLSEQCIIVIEETAATIRLVRMLSLTKVLIKQHVQSSFKYAMGPETKFSVEALCHKIL